MSRRSRRSPEADDDVDLADRLALVTEPVIEQWRPDILGHPFEQRTLTLGEDDEGPVVATLVRSIPHRLATIGKPLADVDVLYVHGWSDFFFQVDLARFWTDRGARFHALDLRKYGRSLRPGQTPGYIEHLDDYDADIAAALDAMGRGTDAGSRRPLILFGHSTGGLTLTLWAARHPGAAAALVLNSPWLELQLGAIGRQALAPLIGMRARVAPHGPNPGVDPGYYRRAQSVIGSLPTVGEPEWRPERAFPTHPGWLAAIVEAHREVARGVEAGCPVLVLLSARSSSPFTWSDADSPATDAVLVVDEIARAATRIGRLVTIARIDGAIHDIFLSHPEPRQRAFEVLGDWVGGGLAAALR